MSFWSVTRANLRKDLLLEWRSKDALNAVGFFSLLVVVIFSFAFEPSAEESRRIAGGIFWVSFLFAAVIALNQTWARELRHQLLDAYRIAPASGEALFLSKALGNFLFVALIEALATPLIVIFYNLHALGDTRWLLAVVPLGTWALVVNGTFFAALSIRTRNREVMLPLLLFPISVPAILAMVQATTAILGSNESPTMWIKLLAGYDVIFTTAGLLLFNTVLEAE
jgi:heme exporter protein B